MNLQNARCNAKYVEKKVQIYFGGKADSCESYSFVPEHATESSDSVLTINNRMKLLISKENKHVLSAGGLVLYKHHVIVLK